MISRTPAANIDHSTIGLSKNLPPLLARLSCGRHLAMRGRIAQGACGKRHGGLGLARRARGMSDQCCAFGGRGLMAATVATVAYLGLEARAVEVQVQLSSGLPRFTIVGLPDKAVARKPRAGAGGACRRSASRFRPRSSRSTCRRPTCPRKARITTCRSRSCLLAAIGATDAETLSRLCRGRGAVPRRADRRLAGRAARRAPCLVARQGADLPRGAGQRSRLGGRARRHRRARPAGVARPSQGHGSGCGAGRGRGRSRPTADPTWPRSRGRRSPSARSRSPRRAGTIC